VPGLSGTGRVAGDLYLMGHHEITGKPHVQPRALGLGLAGGLLAELMLGRHIGLWQERVVVASRAVPGDELTGHLLGLLASERERRPVRDWLVFLGRTAAGDVARRLAGAGYLTVARSRWRGRRWVPADPDSAFAPILRVTATMDRSRPLTAHNAVLAGLVTACGLDFRLPPYTPPRTDRTTKEAVAQLHPALRELIAHTQAAVDAALLAHRA